MAATGLHVSLSAEPIAHIGDFPVTNSMFTSVIVSILIITFAVVVRLNLKDTSRPKGIQNFAEWIVESLFNFVNQITGDIQKSRVFFPFIATFFLFIIVNNWFGLLPGVGTIKTAISEKTTVEKKVTEHVTVTEKSTEVVLDESGHEVQSESTGHTTTAEKVVSVESEPEQHTETVPLFRAGTADLNTTIALGVISIVLVQFFGVQYLRLAYFSKYFNFSSPVMFFVGLLELISECAKIISFAFRLFGNIFAGEVLISVVMYLVGLGVPIPFYGLEVFVGFIQALVFSMLSLVFFNMATQGHSEHD